MRQELTDRQHQAESQEASLRAELAGEQQGKAAVQEEVDQLRGYAPVTG